MTEEKILEEIKPFTDACEKMAVSKFIMIDKRIGDVLKSIAQIEPVFNVIKECMINFNFENEWRMATSKVGYLMPPEESHRFVAFVFAILNLLDDKKFGASDFLSKYFSKSESEAGPYSDFCQTLVIKFKNLIVAKLLNKSEVVQEPKPKVVVNIDKDVMSRLGFLAKDLKDYVQGLKRVKKSSVTKGEFLEIINGLIEAIKNEDGRYLKSFVLAIKAGHGKDKEIEARLVEILDIVDKTFIDA